jgi:hypothetical protein
MVGSLDRAPEPIHPHARLVARRYGLPEKRLAYLEDPDDIDEMAQAIVRRREHAQRSRQRLYWTVLYGGTGVLLVAGLLVSAVWIAVAILWLIVVAALGMLFLKPPE